MNAFLVSPRRARASRAGKRAPPCGYPQPVFRCAHPGRQRSFPNGKHLAYPGAARLRAPSPGVALLPVLREASMPPGPFQSYGRTAP
jgi:hypothetical protein